MSSSRSFHLCRKVEQRFHMCDRMAIYFFIAASYSPWWVIWLKLAKYIQFKGWYTWLWSLNTECCDMSPQADAEGAGALVVPHALAHMGHGICWIHLCLLLPWEVTQPLSLCLSALCPCLTQLTWNQTPLLFTGNTELLFEAETVT